MSSLVTSLFPALGCPEMIISCPSKLDHASLYFKLIGSASGSKLTVMGAGGGCPSKGTLESSSMIDLRLFSAVGSGPRSEPCRKMERGPITSLAESAGTSRGSEEKLGGGTSDRALLLAANQILVLCFR